MSKSWIPIPRHERKYKGFGYAIQIDVRNGLSWEVWAIGPEDHQTQPLMSNTAAVSPMPMSILNEVIRDSHNSARHWIDLYIEQRKRLKRAMSQNKSYRESESDSR